MNNNRTDRIQALAGGKGILGHTLFKGLGEGEKASTFEESNRSNRLGDRRIRTEEEPLLLLLLQNDVTEQIEEMTEKGVCVCGNQQIDGC